MSASGHALAAEGKPPPAGDRNRKEKNYLRNRAKKERLQMKREGKAVDTQALLQGMKKMENERSKQDKTNAANLK